MIEILLAVAAATVAVFYTAGTVLIVVEIVARLRRGMA